MVPIEYSAVPPRPPALRTLWRFMRWMIQTDPPRALALLGLNLVTGLLPAASVWIVRGLFDRSLDVYEGRLAVAGLLAWVALWAGLALLQGTVRPFLTALLIERLKQEMEDRLLVELQGKARRLRLEVFERADFHDILRRAQEAATPGFFLNLLGEIQTIFSGTLTALSVALIVGLWNPLLLVALVLVALPPPLAHWQQGRDAFLLKRAQTQHERLRGYLGRILSERAAAKEVRVFDLGPGLLQWWTHLYWQVANRLFNQQRRQTAVDGALSAGSLLGLAAAIGWAAWAVALGALSAGQFAAMMVALREIRTSVDLAVRRFGYLANRLLNIADLFAYLDFGPEQEDDGEAPGHLNQIPIAARDLSFTYPQADNPALEDLSFTIEPGQRIALVGANGSGKTTLVKVLLGLFQPTRGAVLYGDLDLERVSRQQLWDQAAAVFQDYTRFAFTLGENIGLGRNQQMNDEAAVRQAAQQGGADVVAAQLPQGYDTQLTREFSGGTELSGGQWQRVAIARGFMRNAALVALDEPTASLDPMAEAEIFRRFLELSGGRTTIVVSHRLGSARLCDRILVLKEGRLVEEGTHDQLLAQRGEYARMWALQAQWYGGADI
ncbi:MAG: ATP-binding cassette domain-containing protein [Candidatus Latescibacteria bacterium]|nr:ATP-binding cassette domain-containing protein [Candidatus Latescibacterota bacterium]